MTQQLTSRILAQTTPDALLLGLAIAVAVVVVMLIAVAVIAILLLRRSSEPPHDPAVDDLALTFDHAHAPMLQQPGDSVAGARAGR